MHNHEYENELKLLLNELHFHMKGCALRLALRNRLTEIRKKPNLDSAFPLFSLQTITAVSRTIIMVWVQLQKGA